MPYADPEARRRYLAEYRTARRSELAAKQREYYQRTRTESDDRSAAYLERNPQLKRAISFANRANQRAAAWGVEGKLYARALVRWPTDRCVYCGCVADSWDHVTPFCQGGENTYDNLVRCCRRCNKVKSNRDRTGRISQPYAIVWLLCGWRVHVWKPGDLEQAQAVLQGTAS